jgi:hypothetical protein
MWPRMKMCGSKKTTGSKQDSQNQLMALYLLPKTFKSFGVPTFRRWGPRMGNNFRFTEQFNCCPNVLNRKYMECNNICPYENKTGNQVKVNTELRRAH